MQGNQGQEIILWTSEWIHPDSTHIQKASGSPCYFSYTRRGKKKKPGNREYMKSQLRFNPCPSVDKSLCPGVFVFDPNLPSGKSISSASEINHRPLKSLLNCPGERP